MKRILRKDPIVEAVCEFHLDAPDWDWTVPGLVWANIRNEFPLRQEQTHINFQVDTTPEGVVPNAHAGLGAMQFWKQNRTALVQVGPQHLSIHQLKPYTGWPDFSKMIGEVLEHYEAAVPFHAIKRIALRYINRLPLPTAPFEVTDVLNTYPNIPGPPGQEWGSWMQRVEIMRPEKGAVFLVQAGFIPRLQVGEKVEDGEPAHLMMLDLVFAHAKPEPITRTTVSSWLESAHEEIETMFFDSLQPGFLQLLEPEERKDDAN